jgi:fatty-acyl-CoA synthase
MSQMVTDPLRYWARMTPDAPAIVFQGAEQVSYRELDRWTDGVAAQLQDRAVAVADRVGIVGNNSLAWCAGAIGALKAGAILACYNHRLVAPELRYLIDNSEPRLVLAGAEHLDRLAEVGGLGSAVDVVSLTEMEAARTAAQPRRPASPVWVPADEPAVIVYTSGTTAQPKGVIFTHRTTFSFIFEWSLMEPAYQHGCRMIFVLSLGGAPGILWAVLHMLTHGGTLYLETGFEPEATLQRLVDERIGVMMGVPFLFEQIAAQPSFAEADLSGLKATTVGGARVPKPTIDAWLAKGVALRQIYGMTELGGSSIGNSPQFAASRPESVGRPSLFTEHRVVRPDGTDCDPDEPGEIIVRGPSVTPGYWRNEAATREAIRNGWFHSGDVGVLDPEGHLRVVDRLKDMIISGGYNIAPSEVEEVIQAVPGVHEVAVIGVDDPRYGETPLAIVNGTVNPDLVIAHCRRNLAGYKVPRHVITVGEPLPRMPSGKIAKRALRQQYGPSFSDGAGP